MPRVALVAPSSPPEGTRTVSSGSALLDLVLGGGWGAGRVCNVVGDRSSGKTLLAIEAAANFKLAFPKSRVQYTEAEAAFDDEYAATLGMPLDVVTQPDVHTVEQWHTDLLAFCGKCDPETPNLYVLDSLDALSDDAEMERDIDDNSYGANKAKKISEMFRRNVKTLEAANVTLMVISQIRDKLNVTFGETKTRSGGRALDFYCSQILWLAEISKIKRTVHGIDRAYGIKILAKTKKNKIGIPFRDAQLTLLFGYGLDDETSMIEWLKLAKVFDKAEGDRYIKLVMDARDSRDMPERVSLRRQLMEMTQARWSEIEQRIAPTASKYW